MATFITVAFDDDDEAEIFSTCMDMAATRFSKRELDGTVNWYVMPYPNRIVKTEFVTQED